MVVVGIDPGIATTGYGFVCETSHGALEVVEYGVIRTSAELPHEKRLLQLFQRLRELVILHQPESGAVEKLFFQRNVKTAITVGQGRGVVLLALAQADVAVAEYTPLEVKQAVAGYGGADKRQIQEMVRVLLDLEEIPKPDDAADALAVAICHLHSAKMLNLIQTGDDS